MKNLRLTCVALCCILCSWYAPTVQAQQQTVEELEVTLRQIGTDLSEKTQKLSWDLTEDYLKYCGEFDRLIELGTEDYLNFLTTVKKPKELAAYDKAYEKTKKRMNDYLLSFDEYVQMYSRRKDVKSETDRKDIDAAIDSYKNWLWNNDEKYKKLSNAHELAMRKYNLEAVRYMYNEYKKAGRIMPTPFISREDRRYLLSNNAELKFLSDEVEQLGNMQRRLSQIYQAKKYDVTQESRGGSPLVY